MKLSWSEVAALGLLLLFAMVMANGWPQGSWKLDWTALSAICTFFAALVALHIGLSSIKSQREVLLSVANNMKPRIEKKIKYISGKVEGIAHTLGNARQDRWRRQCGFSRIDYETIKLYEIKVQVSLLRKEILELQAVDFSVFGVLDKTMPSALAVFSLEASSSMRFVDRQLRYYANEIAYGRTFDVSDTIAGVSSKVFDDTEELVGLFKELS